MTLQNSTAIATLGVTARQGNGNDAKSDKAAFEARIAAEVQAHLMPILERIAATMEERLRQIATQRGRMIFNPEEAAIAFGITPKDIKKLVNSGQIDARRLDRHIFITRSSLEAFIARLPRVNSLDT